MSKDITEDILLKAGFEEIDRVDNVSITFELKKWDIEWDIESDWDITMTKYNRSYGRKWSCDVNNDESNFAYIDIQTIEHFNKLMEVLDIDFRLKEE